MVTKGPVPSSTAALATQSPGQENVGKEKKKKGGKKRGAVGKEQQQGVAVGGTRDKLRAQQQQKKKEQKVKRAMALAILEDIGMCPISMEPMRRPVLPSSGQAYDEINIVRYCSQGNKRCPVSGGSLKVSKSGKVMSTVDFNLRKLIITQAAQAKLVLPSTDKDTRFRELRESFMPGTAKAIVDDCYLGYIPFEDLQGLLEELSAGRTEEGQSDRVKAAFACLLAECFACRSLAMVRLAVEFLNGYESAWNDARVLSEALAVGQDPDCRGQVLVVLEGKVQRGTYQASHINTILGFETESVPVQQFQGRVAAAVIGHAAKGDLREFAGMAPVVNLALRVREDLDGCMEMGDEDGEDEECIYSLWALALEGLQVMGEAMDDICLERLFWKDNQMILRHLASNHHELLQWHFHRHPSALALCISALGGHHGRSNAPESDFQGDIYTSEEDYFSEEEDELPRHPREFFPINALSEFINNTPQRRPRHA